MAMHDDAAVIDARVQELVTDPEQVVTPLAVERHARPYAGMHEEIASFFVAKRQAFEEGQVTFRHRAREKLLRPLQHSSIARSGSGATP